jgi:RimJ/RimL family protein N-acetyltransferase
MWLEWFQSLSEQSIRYRFFQMLKDTPHEVRVRYCNVDYDREVAMVAELMEAGNRKILGVSRLSAEPDGKSGELAFIVGDRWQNMGLGTQLVDYVLDIAERKGVESVYSIMLPDNYRALSLTKKMGFDIENLADGTIKGTLNLKEDLPGEICVLPKPETETPQPTIAAPEPEKPAAEEKHATEKPSASRPASTQKEAVPQTATMDMPKPKKPEVTASSS